jgi:hypothetical protein
MRVHMRMHMHTHSHTNTHTRNLCTNARKQVQTHSHNYKHTQTHSQLEKLVMDLNLRKDNLPVMPAPGQQSFLRPPSKRRAPAQTSRPTRAGECKK